MEIKNIGYNIGEITIDTALTSGTQAEVGTLDDLKKIYNIAKNSGIARINANINDVDMSGCCFLNPFVDADGIGVDIAGVSNFGGLGTLIHGTAKVSSGKMVAVVTVTALTQAAALSSTKAVKTSK